jgi:voltage-gated potassium channel
MASSATGSHPVRPCPPEAAFLHGFRLIRGIQPALLHKADFGRLGHEWGTKRRRFCAARSRGHFPSYARKAQGRSERPTVVSLLLAFRGLARAVAAVWRDPETKALPFVAGALVFSGTIFYWRFEDWTFIQSLYFAVVTLTTVGYGDLHPTSDGTRIFTIIYILTGLGVLVALLGALAQQYIRLKAESGHTRERLSALRHRERPTDEGGSQ